MKGRCIQAVSMESLRHRSREPIPCSSVVVLVFVCVFFFVCLFVLIWAHCIALASPRLLMSVRLASNSWRSADFCLSDAGIQVMHHHTLHVVFAGGGCFVCVVKREFMR